MVLRDGARAASIEGLMLKRADAPYLPGRVKGLWWKWKRDPLSVDAVLMYAQRGHGKRSSFYSDYTFGLWRDNGSGEDELVPVGKAYFGFTDEELAFLDRWIRNHTVARFGPVREVEKALVLEVAFDAAQLSTRHKSGVAMRFPAHRAHPHRQAGGRGGPAGEPDGAGGEPGGEAGGAVAANCHCEERSDAAISRGGWLLIGVRAMKSGGPEWMHSDPATFVWSEHDVHVLA